MNNKKILYVYISGPYSSDPMAGIREAIREGMKVRDLGETSKEYSLVPIIPHLSGFMDFLDSRQYGYWLGWDLDLIEICDVVLRIPGESPGADVEVARAMDLEIPVITGSIFEDLDWISPELDTICISKYSPQEDVKTVYTEEEVEEEEPGVENNPLVMRCGPRVGIVIDNGEFSSYLLDGEKEYPCKDNIDACYEVIKELVLEIGRREQIAQEYLSKVSNVQEKETPDEGRWEIL